MLEFKELTSSFIANTTMKEVYIDNELKLYEITPNEGYVVHINKLDKTIDIEGNIVEPPVPQYTVSTISVNANYNFFSNPENIYTILKEKVINNIV